MKLIDQGGTKADRLLETQEIHAYIKKEGETPAGNKIYH